MLRSSPANQVGDKTFHFHLEGYNLMPFFKGGAKESIPLRYKFSVPIRCGEMASGVPPFNCPTERARLKKDFGLPWKCGKAILGNTCF